MQALAIALALLLTGSALVPILVGAQVFAVVWLAADHLGILGDA
jgi:hypothetical protein